MASSHKIQDCNALEFTDIQGGEKENNGGGIGDTLRNAASKLRDEYENSFIRSESDKENKSLTELEKQTKKVEKMGLDPKQVINQRLRNRSGKSENSGTSSRPFEDSVNKIRKEHEERARKSSGKSEKNDGKPVRRDLDKVKKSEGISKNPPPNGDEKTQNSTALSSEPREKTENWKESTNQTQSQHQLNEPKMPIFEKNSQNSVRSSRSRGSMSSKHQREEDSTRTRERRQLLEKVNPANFSTPAPPKPVSSNGLQHMEERHSERDERFSKCSYCQRRGHQKRNCARKTAEDELEAEVEKITSESIRRKEKNSRASGSDTQSTSTRCQERRILEESAKVTPKSTGPPNRTLPNPIGDRPRAETLAEASARLLRAREALEGRPKVVPVRKAYSNTGTGNFPERRTPRLEPREPARLGWSNRSQESSRHHRSNVEPKRADPTRYQNIPAVSAPERASAANRYPELSQNELRESIDRMRAACGNSLPPPETARSTGRPGSQRGPDDIIQRGQGVSRERLNRINHQAPSRTRENPSQAPQRTLEENWYNNRQIEPDTRDLAVQDPQFNEDFTRPTVNSAGPPSRYQSTRNRPQFQEDHSRGGPNDSNRDDRMTILLNKLTRQLNEKDQELEWREGEVDRVTAALERSTISRNNFNLKGHLEDHNGECRFEVMDGVGKEPPKPVYHPKRHQVLSYLIETIDPYLKQRPHLNRKELIQTIGWGFQGTPAIREELIEILDKHFPADASTTALRQKGYREAVKVISNRSGSLMLRAKKDTESHLDHYAYVMMYIRITEPDSTEDQVAQKALDKLKTSNDLWDPEDVLALQAILMSSEDQRDTLGLDEKLDSKAAKRVMRRFSAARCGVDGLEETTKRPIRLSAVEIAKRELAQLNSIELQKKLIVSGAQTGPNAFPNGPNGQHHFQGHQPSGFQPNRNQTSFQPASAATPNHTSFQTSSTMAPRNPSQNGPLPGILKNANTVPRKTYPKLKFTPDGRPLLDENDRAIHPDTGETICTKCSRLGMYDQGKGHWSQGCVEKLCFYCHSREHDIDECPNKPLRDRPSFANRGPENGSKLMGPPGIGDKPYNMLQNMPAASTQSSCAICGGEGKGGKCTDTKTCECCARCRMGGEKKDVWMNHSDANHNKVFPSQASTDVTLVSNIRVGSDDGPIVPLNQMTSETIKVNNIELYERLDVETEDGKSIVIYTNGDKRYSHVWVYLPTQGMYLQVKADTACVSNYVDGVISPELATQLGMKGTSAEAKVTGVITVADGKDVQARSQYTMAVQAGSATVILTFMELPGLTSHMLLGNRGMTRLGVRKKIENIFTESDEELMANHGLSPELFFKAQKQGFRGGPRESGPK